ncbi:MAG: hypothetical protein AD742_12505 [Methylibium sp. NZG]|nr:MAG: hypothetical protein AD742_12505 [Methylibium sp. NZG]
MPCSGTPFKKNGGSSRQPCTPRSVACLVSATASGSAAQLVEARMRAAGTPCATSPSSAAMRSATVNDGPSPVVPKGVTPVQPASSSDLQCAAKAGTSMFSAASSGVSNAGQMPL